MFRRFTENAHKNPSLFACIIFASSLSTDQWCRRWRCRGWKRTHKSFDLSKIRANPWKSGKKWRPTFDFFLQSQRKTHEDPLFLEVTPKRSLWSLWEEICREKSHKNFSGKFGEIREINSSHPQKFACS